MYGSYTYSYEKTYARKAISSGNTQFYFESIKLDNASLHYALIDFESKQSIR